MQPMVPIDHVANELHGRLAQLHALVTSWLGEYLSEHRSDIVAAFLRVPGNGRLIFEAENTVAESFAAFRAAEPEHFEPQISRHQAARVGMGVHHMDPRECRLLLCKFNRARRLRGQEFLPLGPRLDHMTMGRENSFHENVDIDREAGHGLPEQLRLRHMRNGVSSSRDGMMALGHRSTIGGVPSELTELITAAADAATADGAFKEERAPAAIEDAAPKQVPAAKLLPRTAKGA